MELRRIAPDVWVDPGRVIAVEPGMGNFCVVHMADGGDQVRLSVLASVEDVVASLAPLTLGGHGY